MIKITMADIRNINLWYIPDIWIAFTTKSTEKCKTALQTFGLVHGWQLHGTSENFSGTPKNLKYQ